MKTLIIYENTVSGNVTAIPGQWSKVIEHTFSTPEDALAFLKEKTRWSYLITGFYRLSHTKTKSVDLNLVNKLFEKYAK